MPSTLIPDPLSAPLSQEAIAKFWSSWSNPKLTKPTIVGVFYVNHQGPQQCWTNYEQYKARVGNEKYMWHGTTRTCTIGDDMSQVTACQRSDCSVCHILRATLDPSRADPDSMFGIGAYVAPNSSKSFKYLEKRGSSNPNSPNVVMLRCAVAIGRTYPAKGPMKGRTSPPSGYDSISGKAGKTLTGRKPGQTISNDETVVFTKAAILPVEVIVLRKTTKPKRITGNRFSAFTRKLENITTANWNIYPEAIRDTYKGEILWTDGKVSHAFASAPNIQAYKVVRKDRSGNVIAEGLASSNPYYFKLL